MPSSVKARGVSQRNTAVEAGRVERSLLRFVATQPLDDLVPRVRSHNAPLSRPNIVAMPQGSTRRDVRHLHGIDADIEPAVLVDPVLWIGQRTPIVREPVDPIPIVKQRVGSQDRNAFAGELVRKWVVRFRNRVGAAHDRSTRNWTTVESQGSFTMGVFLILVTFPMSGCSQ